jgi:hypothetical protein
MTHRGSYSTLDFDSQNFSDAKSLDNLSNGWSDLYIYILAGIGLAAIGFSAYLIVENSKK